jgi:hypothetical protein
MRPCSCSATYPSPSQRHALPTYRYTARGERIDPRGGIYWIPEHDFAAVVARAKRCPAILNDYAFEPLPSGGRGGCE